MTPNYTNFLYTSLNILYISLTTERKDKIQKISSINNCLIVAIQMQLIYLNLSNLGVCSDYVRVLFCFYHWVKNSGESQLTVTVREEIKYPSRNS